MHLVGFYIHIVRWCTVHTTPNWVVWSNHSITPITAKSLYAQKQYCKRPTRKHNHIIVHKLKLCNCLQALFHCDTIVHNYWQSCHMRWQYSPPFCSAKHLSENFHISVRRSWSLWSRLSVLKMRLSGIGSVNVASRLVTFRKDVSVIFKFCLPF